MQNDILILGFGISGQAAARLARELGMNPIPVDGKSYDWNGRSVFHWKEGCPLPETEYAVISPGISIHSAMAQAARNAGAAVIGELEFACRALPCRYVAITGTNGKTTTTELTTALFRANGVRAESAGNIGNALSDAVLDVRHRNNTDLLVVETSSFQLESIADRFAPSTAAFLNLASDHINRHGSMQEYRNTKLRIFENMRSGTAVVNAKLLSGLPSGPLDRLSFSSEKGGDFECDGSSILFRGKTVAALDGLKLKGMHNMENIMAALAILCAEQGGEALFTEETRQALRAFSPDVHRMELFAEADGIRFFDDSKATNPHSVNAFLNTYGGSKNVVLILGGLDKNMRFASIRNDADKIKCAFLIGQCREKIRAELIRDFPCTLCDSLEDAAERGFRAAENGDILALSPACASMDMFKDYKERGERFKAVIRQKIGKNA